MTYKIPFLVTSFTALASSVVLMMLSMVHNNVPMWLTGALLFFLSVVFFASYVYEEEHGSRD